MLKKRPQGVKHLGDLGCFKLERGFGFLNHAGECFGIPDRQVSQNLAIQLDVRFPHAKYKFAVGKTVCAGTRVDAYDPKPAKIALAILAVPGGIPHAFEHGFVGAPEQAAARAEIAFVILQYFLVSQMGYWSTFYTSHVYSFTVPWAPANGQLRAPNSRTNKNYLFFAMYGARRFTR
jgi:hypothetical protein